MLLFTIAVISHATPPLQAQTSEATPQSESFDEQKSRRIAVALNYCRASFHRIRKYPNPQVLNEEREKILNNLNLNEIRDEEVIRLYTDVLDEIGQIELTDREEELYDIKYKRALRQEVAIDSLSIGLDLLSAQFIGAVRTGANSWWDYRSFKWNRDNEVFKLEKNRVSSVVKKSSNFLDTFWKLTQEHNIPDRWLVRSTDLDDLETAMNEDDLDARLRILRRMKPFMECYPPYWYYLARTQQASGDLVAALDSYGQLSSLGTNHFRRDDMLASAFANQAVIEAHLHQGDPVQTARTALKFSTQVWEANLACARILQQAGSVADAEDAILRNLDVGLETAQSTVTLLTFYHDTGNTTQLARYLTEEKVIALIPPPVLIRFASRIPQEQTPPVVWTALASTLRVYPQVGFGQDDLILACHPVWSIERGKLSLRREDGTQIAGEYFRQGDLDFVKFSKVADFGGVITGPSSLPRLSLNVKYDDTHTIQLAFSPDALPGQELTEQTSTARSPSENRGYHLIAAQWDDQSVAYVPQFPQTADIYDPVEFHRVAASLGTNSDPEIKSANKESQQPEPKKDSTIR
ncbi:MAG: hypothetical protein KDA78_14725 [Planctomycetaceae bacterium]|nr:hypothetical protein [Planctomycetaceae bacterium]